MERKIRNSAKVLVFKDGCMAAVKIDDNGDVFYIMPGGGQDSEELLCQAAVRECAEELGIVVEVKDLAFVVEGVYGEAFHRVDMVFLCQYVVASPMRKSKGIATRWGWNGLPLTAWKINLSIHPNSASKSSNCTMGCLTIFIWAMKAWAHSF